MGTFEEKWIAGLATSSAGYLQQKSSRVLLEVIGNAITHERPCVLEILPPVIDDSMKYKAIL